GVVAETCDKVAVMYAGEIVELGTLEHIFDFTGHPYTRLLFGSLPSLDKKTDRLTPISGLMPDPMNLPKGCRFHPRCPDATERCGIESPANAEVQAGHFVKCIYAGEGRCPSAGQEAGNG
ncbi:MAG: ABC transporter ATP-binding protein, partial [Clostridiales bacterium]|nr:ABC transporter ATP-binding protein [Clostridiales bacterium]